MTLQYASTGSGKGQCRLQGYPAYCSVASDTTAPFYVDVIGTDAVFSDLQYQQTPDLQLFPAIAAALAGMESHREHLRLEKSSANMAAQLERVQRQMKPATDPDRLEDLIHQATEIMLGETQSWLMLMRFVEIKA